MKCSREDKWTHILLVVFVLLALFETLSIILPKFHSKLSNSNSFCDDERAENILQEFYKVQMENLQNINSTGKFIVFQANPHAGLGNRIPPLVSAAILAILERRALLIHWPSEPVSANNANEVLAMVEFKELFEPPFEIDFARFTEFYSAINESNAIGISLNHVKDEEADKLLCTNLMEKYKETRFIVLHGFRPILDTLAYNPYYNEKLVEFGFKTSKNGKSDYFTSSVMKAVGRCLLRPSKGVRDMLQKFKNESSLLPHQQVIGVHIRATSNHSLNATQQETLWKLVTKKYPPAAQGTPKSNANLFYFLASDSNSTLQNVPESVKPYLLFQTGTEITRITKEGIQRALTDLLLLGNTKEFFGTRSTTFVVGTRVLYETPFSLIRAGGRKGMVLDKVGELPCLVNWKSYDVSCLAMDNYIC